MIEKEDVFEIDLKSKRLELMIDDLKNINSSLDHVLAMTNDVDVINKANMAQEALKASQKSVTEAWVYIEFIYENLVNKCRSQQDEPCVEYKI